MKNKASKIQKLIEENFSHKENDEEDEYEEDNLVKRTVHSMLNEEIEEFPSNDAGANFNLFRNKTFPADDILSSKTYKGKRVSRKSLEEKLEIEDESESEFSDAEESPKKIKRVTFADPLTESEQDSDEDVASEEIEDDEEENSSNENEESQEDESIEDESEIEDDLSEDEVKDASFVYSKGVRNESGEREKGEAIRAQLNLCELLLESRITLQKALFSTNQLPRPQNYEKIWAEGSEDEKKVVTECRESIWDLLEHFLRLQCKFRKRCPEFMQTLDESTQKEYEDFEDSEPKVKRRKLAEYPMILDELHNQYKPYRNNVIQKWNDRTKIASGKLAKTNFSAFDLPILKQIEQITADKQRLIQRTHIKRANYNIVGDDEITNDENQEQSEPSFNADYEEEIFDDDDFYHKLLRDYIERKTADVSDPTQLGRKWIKLQSLRSKMKRKIDTRRTKGRKIKFDVHPKLVNFMAPVILNSWTDTAINELYSSVFGKNLINS